ncbi:periplasmic repressor CpxP [Marinomonas hwangdonensis]|uniref:Periplasmic repressor CpxP n=1 Tax=Marinomonas hwangdonensis TaxID=1053647 RepID=A0A3M8QAC1_9GAMM|nr:CpxP family protein [Marinomonas hwangdonensis]RNF53007.1 periplasmic repressor CpxP [Marinomonas hwangdonensis]
MKMAKKLILASLVLPLAISAGSAFAYGGKDHRGSHNDCRSGMDRSMMKDLNLTDDQKTQLKELRRANKDTMKRGGKEQTQQEAHRNQLNELLLADNFDTTKAKALAEQMSDTHTERQVEKLSKQHQMLSVLTPEQKTQFIEQQKNHMDECANDKSERKGDKSDRKDHKQEGKGERKSE